MISNNQRKSKKRDFPYEKELKGRIHEVWDEFEKILKEIEGSTASIVRDENHPFDFPKIFYGSSNSRRIKKIINEKRQMEIPPENESIDPIILEKPYQEPHKKESFWREKTQERILDLGRLKRNRVTLYEHMSPRKEEKKNLNESIPIPTSPTSRKSRSTFTNSSRPSTGKTTLLTSISPLESIETDGSYSSFGSSDSNRVSNHRYLQYQKEEEEEEDVFQNDVVKDNHENRSFKPIKCQNMYVEDEDFWEVKKSFVSPSEEFNLEELSKRLEY